MELTGALTRLGLTVDSEAISALERLVEELLRWNRSRNLTAITVRDEVLEKHLVDSLTLLPFARQANRLLDIGSGAGFPSLPLKIACPALPVVSVDAVGKKVDFQRYVARTLGLKGFLALHERIENLASSTKFRSRFDLVTARALCSLEDLVEMAEPFLAPAGRIVAMKGPEGNEEVVDLKGVLEASGWRINSHHLSLPVSGATRSLIELSRKP